MYTGLLVRDSCQRRSFGGGHGGAAPAPSGRRNLRGFIRCPTGPSPCIEGRLLRYLQQGKIETTSSNDVQEEAPRTFALRLLSLCVCLFFFSSSPGKEQTPRHVRRKGKMDSESALLHRPQIAAIHDVRHVCVCKYLSLPSVRAPFREFKTELMTPQCHAREIAAGVFFECLPLPD